MEKLGPINLIELIKKGLYLFGIILEQRGKIIKNNIFLITLLRTRYLITRN